MQPSAVQNRETQPTQREDLEQMPPLRVSPASGNSGAFILHVPQEGQSLRARPLQLRPAGRADSWRSSADRTSAVGGHLLVCHMVSQAPLQALDGSSPGQDPARHLCQALMVRGIWPLLLEACPCARCSSDRTPPLHSLLSCRLIPPYRQATRHWG